MALRASTSALGSLRTSALAAWVALSLAGPALADITPEEAWTAWKDYRNALGQVTTAEASERQGDRLIVSGVKLTQSGTLDQPAVSALFGSLTFEAVEGGKVRVIWPEEFTAIALVNPNPRLGTALQKEVALKFVLKGADIIASGTPDAVVFDTSIREANISSAIPDGDAVIDFSARASGISSREALAGTRESREVSSDFRVMALDMTARQQGEGGTALELNLANLTAEAAGTGIPPGGLDEEMRFISQGGSMDLTLGLGMGMLRVNGGMAGQNSVATGLLSGATLVFGAKGDHVAFDVAAKSASSRFSDPTDDVAFPMSGAVDLSDLQMRLTIDGMNWQAEDPFDPQEAPGLAVSGDFSLGPSVAKLREGIAEGTQRFEGLANLFEMALAIDEKSSHLSAGVKGWKSSTRIAELSDQPMDMAMDDVALDTSFPMSKDEAPQPFNFLLKLNELTFGEGLWNQIDPSDQLPRSPASFVLDLKGEGILSEDWNTNVDDFSAEPFEATLLQLDQFLLRALGAELHGLGRIEIKPGDMSGPVPKEPDVSGKMAFGALGVIGLMDKLVAAGAMRPEDVTMARMMTGAFAKIDPVKDEITSELEFRDGHIFANGQMVQ